MRTKPALTFTPPYKCIITDDDEIDRLTTVSFVKKYPILKIAGVYSSPFETIKAIKNKKADIAFLDIDMPGINGLELRKQLSHIPAVIFITSYPDYAVEGFELAALDFLIKPINTDRFAITINRVHEYFTLKNKSSLLEYNLGGDIIFIKEGTKLVKLSLHTIIYLEALKDYTTIVTTEGKYHILCTLGNLLKEKSFCNFIRVHKSYAVQPVFITTINTSNVTANGHSLPIGRAYKADFFKLMNL